MCLIGKTSEKENLDEKEEEETEEGVEGERLEVSLRSSLPAPFEATGYPYLGWVIHSMESQLTPEFFNVPRNRLRPLLPFEMGCREGKEVKKTERNKRKRGNKEKERGEETEGERNRAEGTNEQSRGDRDRLEEEEGDGEPRQGRECVAERLYQEASVLLKKPIQVRLSLLFSLSLTMLFLSLFPTLTCFSSLCA